MRLLSDIATSFSTEYNYIWNRKPLQYAQKHCRQKELGVQKSDTQREGKAGKNWCKQLTSVLLISVEAGTSLCFSLVESKVQLAPLESVNWF